MSQSVRSKLRPLNSQLIASIADTVDSVQSLASEATDAVNQAAQTAAVAVAASPAIVNPNNQPGPFDFIADALESLLKVNLPTPNYPPLAALHMAPF